MDLITERIKHLTKEFKEYIETRLDLMMLNLGEQLTLWLGETIQKLIGFTVLGVGSLFALIAFAIFLGDLLANPALGYLITGAPLILIGALLTLAKPRRLARSIQQQFMEGILKSIENKTAIEKPELPEANSKKLKEGHEQKS